MHHRENQLLFPLPRGPETVSRVIPKHAACSVGRPLEKLNCAKDYIMPALVPLLAGLLEANSCMVSRMYLCGFTAVSWMRTS